MASRRKAKPKQKPKEPQPRKKPRVQPAEEPSSPKPTRKEDPNYVPSESVLFMIASLLQSEESDETGDEVPESPAEILQTLAEAHRTMGTYVILLNLL